MGTIDDLPTIDANHDIEEAAETAFAAAIKESNRFLIQQKDRKDYGTDVQLEARDRSSPTNLRVHVQLKGTTRAANADQSVSVSVRRTNLNYLLRQPDSIFVCFHLPSNRLLFQFAQEVYREYEHRNRGWQNQADITVRFAAVFDEAFQERLCARAIASGGANLRRRLDWSATPPDGLSSLLSSLVPHVEVPPDPERAATLLRELYRRGQDQVISTSFELFAAVLDKEVGEMDFAYMAEVNIGINGKAFNEERVRDALVAFRSALVRKVVHPGSLLYCMGNAWLALGEHERARDLYLQALPLLSGEGLRGCAAQCLKNVGTVMRGLGDFEAELAFYERALEADPDLGEAHLALGLWHRAHSHDLGTALAHLDQVARRRGSALQMPTVQGWRVELLFRVGNVTAAFREIQILLAEADTLNWIWPWCARQVAEFGRSSPQAAKSARQFWKRYLSAHPGDLFVLRESFFCEALLHRQRAGSTVSFAEFKALAEFLVRNNDSESALIWDRLGHWAQDAGDWVEAEAAYRRAYKLDSGRYGYCLGTALNFLDRFNEALPILKKQAEVHQPDAMSWFQVARAREGISDIGGSIEAYERALALDPEYDLAWFNLGGLYWNSQKTTQAVAIWRQATEKFPDHELTAKLRRDFPLFFHDNPENNT